VRPHKDSLIESPKPDLQRIGVDISWILRILLVCQSRMRAVENACLTRLKRNRRDAPISGPRDDKGMDWAGIHAELDGHGGAVMRGLIAPAECAALREMYRSGDLFRSRIVMARHGFGQGEYQYFKYPLPEAVIRLRTELYPNLAAIANAWNESLGESGRFPASHADYLKLCHEAGQSKPTPLLLEYGAGDYNCLHQDLYGDLVFPLQVAVLLSARGDFTGGEFVLTEQRPRRQSRVEVVPLEQGDAVVFPVHHRPVHGTRGVYRVTMRHGVSRVRSGNRHTLGIIFHDAK